MRYLGLLPGSEVRLALTPATWTVTPCTIEGFVAVIELRPSWRPDIALASDGGRVLPNASIDTFEATLALFDIPEIFDPSSTQPTLVLAASSPASGWRSASVEIDAGSQSFAVQTPLLKTVLGHAVSVLPGAEADLIDTRNAVEIALVDGDQWLLSCDDEALAAGTNIAVLGREIFQFGDAVPLGAGRFRLRRLARGRAGTEWATSIHAIGDAFALLKADTVRRVPLPEWVIGSNVRATPIPTDAASPTTIVASGESLRPPAPVRLTAIVTGTGDLVLSWTRRSRRGWAWIDQVDAALGESREQYEVVVAGPNGSVELRSDVSQLTIPAADLAPVGAGAAMLSVRQIGDWAASRPAECTVFIN